MPQRHSRNNNDLAIFTYEEKRKLGFGSQRERLGKDSIKQFDACCLCLQRLLEPLACRRGHVFCKECIYECLLHQKKGIKKKLALFASQQKQDEEEQLEVEVAEKERRLEAFDRQNNSAVPTEYDSKKQVDRSSSFHGASSAKTTAFEEESLRTMKAYWLPSATPEAVERAEAPSTDTVCPEGKEKLRLKDLYPIIFTELPDPEPSSVVSNDRFICPSCKTTLTNTTYLAAVSTCGHVICKKCADKFVVKDHCCCVCGKACKAKELIEIARGGTGMAGHGENLVGEVFKHLGSGSGAAPLRPVTKL
eukprot:SM000057S18354  [mRNA]  locus=s57:144142:146424:- [translate_table: standard]